MIRKLLVATFGVAALSVATCTPAAEEKTDTVAAMAPAADGAMAPAADGAMAPASDKMAPAQQGRIQTAPVRRVAEDGGACRGVSVSRA